MHNWNVLSTINYPKIVTYRPFQQITAHHCIKSMLASYKKNPSQKTHIVLLVARIAEPKHGIAQPFQPPRIQILPKKVSPKPLPRTKLKPNSEAQLALTKKYKILPNQVNPNLPNLHGVRGIALSRGGHDEDHESLFRQGTLHE